jgi:glutathione synthase/RimK-type ligase-like ATP-grasp enzyme
MFVALASCLDLPEPDVDEPHLVAALARAGIATKVLPWDDGAVDWDAAALVVIRSTWNYHRRPAAFLDWVSARGSRLLNPPAVVQWNHHKRYLRDLERQGIPVVPTLWIDRGAELGDALLEKGWKDVVVKPAVSAGSYRTRRLAGPPFDAAFLRECFDAGDTMIQPYIASVEGYGERSIVCIDREVSHAVRKDARFAGQRERVSAAAADVAADERELARRVLACVEGDLLYARVDLVRDGAGKPMLGELEVIEPSLFLLQHPPSIDRLVAGVVRRLAAAPA